MLKHRVPKPNCAHVRVVYAFIKHINRPPARPGIVKLFFVVDVVVVVCTDEWRLQRNGTYAQMFCLHVNRTPFMNAVIQFKPLDRHFERKRSLSNGTAQKCSCLRRHSGQQFEPVLRMGGALRLGVLIHFEGTHI